MGETAAISTRQPGHVRPTRRLAVSAEASAVHPALVGGVQVVHKPEAVLARLELALEASPLFSGATAAQWQESGSVTSLRLLSGCVRP